MLSRRSVLSLRLVWVVYRCFILFLLRWVECLIVEPRSWNPCERLRMGDIALPHFSQCGCDIRILRCSNTLVKGICRFLHQTFLHLFQLGFLQFGFFVWSLRARPTDKGCIWNIHISIYKVGDATYPLTRQIYTLSVSWRISWKVSSFVSDPWQ